MQWSNLRNQEFEYVFNGPSAMDIPAFSLSENPAKLQHLCRMCATPCNKPVPIFGSIGVENELAMKFNNYLPLKVSETDSIPLNLCYECTNLLIQWDAAVLVAIAADKKLRALLWREQQSQQSSSKESEVTEQLEQQRKRKRSSSGVQESLCCSVCNRSGMDFRELVEHLKSHKEPADDSEESLHKHKSTSQNSSSIQESGDEDCLIDDLLTPVVTLETFDSNRQLRSKKNNSDDKEEKSNSPNNKKGKKGRSKRSSKSFKNMIMDIVGVDGDDPIVTSSTSTPHRKPSDTSESDDTNSSPLNTSNKNTNASSNAATSVECNSKKELPTESQNNTFKPKVRIISAESINQTLEERAKANQTARNLESHQPSGLVHSPPSGNPTSPTKPPVRRLVLSGQIVKSGVNTAAAVNPGQKFLKLSDGRIIKIIQNSVNSSGTIVTSAQKVQVLSKRVPIPGEDLKVSDGVRAPIFKQIVKVGERVFSYASQPGPKNCPNRFICGLCGKRNMNQESLQDHSKFHASQSDN